MRGPACALALALAWEAWEGGLVGGWAFARSSAELYPAAAGWEEGARRRGSLPTFVRFDAEGTLVVEFLGVRGGLCAFWPRGGWEWEALALALGALSRGASALRVRVGLGFSGPYPEAGLDVVGGAEAGTRLESADEVDEDGLVCGRSKWAFSLWIVRGIVLLDG